MLWLCTGPMSDLRHIQANGRGNGSGQGRTAIVAEGGGMRGIFSSGVLDAFAEAGFDPFDLAIGTSAGACTLASHLAGQTGRNRRVFTGQMSRPEFVSLWRYLRGGHLLELDWLWDTLDQEDRLNVEAATSRPGIEFVVVATSALTGRPVYFQPSAPELNPMLKGSSAVPVLYRGPVQIGTEAVVDGGVADPIAVEEAYRRGARRILVIRTRPGSYVKSPGIESWFGRKLLAGYPELAKAISVQAATYRRAVEFIRQPPPDCQIIEIAPEKPLLTGRTTQQKAALEADYALGKKLGQRAMVDWLKTG